MKFSKLIFILAMAVFSNIQAQKFELGKVTIEELQQKEHVKDPSAPAAVLFEKGETTITYADNAGFSLVTEVEVRIKVYKKEGYEWANKAISYYVGANPSEKVFFSKAITYNIVDGKIEKTKLKSDGEFNEQANKFWAVKKITMPNVKEGSVIEYKYTIESPYLNTFPEWKFQRSIPVNYSEYSTNIPEYYTYNTFFKGFIKPTVTKTTQNKSVVISSKENDGGFYTRTTFNNDNVEYLSDRTTYITRDSPAMLEEDFVNNIDNYTASISHEHAMTKFPNSTPKMYSTDWNSVVKTIYDNENFGDELKKNSYFEDDVNALLAGVTNRDEKMILLFDYVKTRMNWNNYLGYLCDSGVKSAYKAKAGNIAEINLMLTAILRYAGFTANPVLVSTRSNGIPIMPNRSAYNYVITAVEENGKIILLDASSKFAQPNILPFRALNWIGMLIRPDGSASQMDLMPKSVSKEQVTMNYTIDVNGGVKGKIRKQYTDYNAQIFRQKYSGVNQDSYLEKLENDMNKIAINEYTRDNGTDPKLPVVETYSFEGTNFFDKTEDRLYITPLLFFSMAQNPFKQEAREYPVDFGFPNQEKYVVNIDIPEGYVVETLPESVNVQTEQNICGFKYGIQVSGNKIQVNFTQDIKLPIVNADDYVSLKDVFQKLVAKQNEKIVLKKG